METWRYACIAGICLTVTLYMFLAVPFPQLRWMFRLKGFAARIFGMGEEENAEFGQRIGLFAAPVIGLITLGFAISTINGCRSDRQRDAQRQEQLEEDELRLVTAFSEWEVTRVYAYGDYRNKQADEAGVAQAEAFVRKLATHSGEGLIHRPRRTTQSLNSKLAIVLAGDPNAENSPALTLLVDPKTRSLTELKPNHRHRAENLRLPEELKEAAGELGKINAELRTGDRAKP